MLVEVEAACLVVKAGSEQRRVVVGIMGGT